MILTLKLDAPAFRWFDAERQANFPAERNFLAAHLTLFHQLCGKADAIAPVLAEHAGGTGPLPLSVVSVGLLGQAVAYRIESAPLQALRASLHGRLEHGGQDDRPFRPHVTVQNKVPAEMARETAEKLAAGFAPFDATGEALQLWHYRGGPWEAAGEFALRRDT